MKLSPLIIKESYFAMRIGKKNHSKWVGHLDYGLSNFELFGNTFLNGLLLIKFWSVWQYHQRTVFCNVNPELNLNCKSWILNLELNFNLESNMSPKLNPEPWTLTRIRTRTRTWTLYIGLELWTLPRVTKLK